jgi:hypothetical protein
VRRIYQPSALPRTAAIVGLCALVVAIGACLNPMPEEFPSDTEATGSAGTPAAPSGAGTGSGFGSGGSGGPDSNSGAGAAGAGGSSSGAPTDDGGDAPDAGTPADAGTEVGDASP